MQEKASEFLEKCKKLVSGTESQKKAKQTAVASLFAWFAVALVTDNILLGMLIAFGFFLALFSAMLLWPIFKRRSYGKKVEAQLPFVLMSIAIELNLGVDFMHCIKDAAKHKSEAGKEFKKAVSAVEKQGASVQEALLQISERTNSRLVNRAVAQLVAVFEQGSEKQAIDLTSLSKNQKQLRFKLHKTIQEVADDMGRRFTFNTAIAKIRELINLLDKQDFNEKQSIAIRQDVLEKVMIMLSPIVPHITHSLWQQLGCAGVIINQSWPEFDEKALIQDSIQYIIQVNGKLRDKIEVNSDATKEIIEKMAMEQEAVKRHLEGKTIRKVIVVPGRLVNIVAN